MSERSLSAALRRRIIERSGNRCEYCLVPAGVAFFPHEVDHIVAIKHGGKTNETNLAFTCWRCNRHKGTDLGSFDPLTGDFSFLFNPRGQNWDDHFGLQGVELMGKSSEGRTTAQLLQLNTIERLTERQRLVEVGLYPDKSASLG